MVLMVSRDYTLPWSQKSVSPFYVKRNAFGLKMLKIVTSDKNLIKSILRQPHTPHDLKSTYFTPSVC